MSLGYSLLKNLNPESSKLAQGRVACLPHPILVTSIRYQGSTKEGEKQLLRSESIKKIEG